MSGGSYEYISCKIEKAAEYARDLEIKDLLKDLAEVLHDDEYAYDGDISEKSYKETLSKFKKKWFKDERPDRLKVIVDKEIDNLRQEIYEMIGVCNWDE
jgi:hypothetical protein